MTSLGAVVGLLVYEVLRSRLSAGLATAAALSVCLAVAAPATVFAAGTGWLIFWVRLRRARHRRPPRAAGVDHLGQVLYVALSAGLSPAAALAFAADEVGSDTAGELRSVLRVARRQGLARALACSDGSVGRLLAVLARAQLTGSSSLTAVEAFVEENRKARRARAMESARKLPVKLTIPLALLILPGFVLLGVGPTVLMTVHRLLGPLLQ